MHLYDPEQPCGMHCTIPCFDDTITQLSKLNTGSIAKNSKLQWLIEDVRIKGGWPLRSELQQVIIPNRLNKCTRTRAVQRSDTGNGWR